jgi:hypothetical protein
MVSESGKVTHRGLAEGEVPPRCVLTRDLVKVGERHALPLGEEQLVLEEGMAVGVELDVDTVGGARGPSDANLEALELARKVVSPTWPALLSRYCACVRPPSLASCARESFGFGVPPLASLYSCSAAISACRWRWREGRREGQQ